MQKTTLDQPFYDTKFSAAREFLEKLIHKFSHAVDSTIFKELNRIFVNLEPSFTNQRSEDHLAKLAYSIYFIRRKFSKNSALFPFKDHFDIRIFPTLLSFTFGSKPVLSILTHARLRDKYEAFDEEQILHIIRKLLPEAQIVTGSTYTFQPPKNTLKTLYFEITKKNGQSFYSSEIRSLKEHLKQEIQFSVEQLVPRVFMIRNEEEVMRNILTLSQEIHYASDLPQVMILFDQQTAKEATFTVILVKVLRKDQPNIQEYFLRIKEQMEYLSDRRQIVRYLRKKHPIEASVFRIKLIKDPSLLRVNQSLNFYLARQKISRLLTEAIGEFRDYNGGIILKQRETLTFLREALCGLSLKDPDLLENFYYSLSPIESQTTLSLESLTTFFKLFIEAHKHVFAKSSDSFFKIQRRKDQLFIMIRIPDEHLRENLESIFSSLKPINQIVISLMTIQQTHFLGCLLANVDKRLEQQLFQSITDALRKWKKRVESRQILKLNSLHYPVSLDPRIGGDQYSVLILKMLFEGLMRINQEGKLENGIAKHVKISSDQQTYHFILRETLWSNEASISAYDFEYAWKKVLSPDFKTPFAYLFYPIKNAKLAKNGAVTADKIGVKALDELTLKVDLEFPAPYFLELTAHTIYSPINRLIDKRHPNWPFESKKDYICNGAFQLKNSNPDQGYELTKNLLYWDASNIKLDEVTILKANRYQSYEMFQKDANHWVGAPLGIWDRNFVKNKNDKLITFKKSSVYWFIFNTQLFPFNNKKIRQSLTWGIDHIKLRKLFDVYPAISPLPPLHSQVKNSDMYTLSLEQAKELFYKALEELKISLKDFPIIPISFLIGPQRNQIAQFIKQQWENTFGINCILEPLEWRPLFLKMSEGNFQVGGIKWEPWFNDPIYTLNAFRNANDSINFSKWENNRFQKTMHLAERETNTQKRQSYYLQAEQILLNEMPVAPIFQVETFALKKKNFHVHCSSSLMNFKWGYFS